MSAYATGDPTVLSAEVRQIVEHAIVNQPRSLQKRIGPSEIGVECTACLVSKLAGLPEARDVAWLPAVGTAVHSFLADIFANYEVERMAAGQQTQRFYVEDKVSCGEIAGVPLTGHADLFDATLGINVDFKIVGATTLRDARRSGPSATYRVQQHTYGRGWARAGHTVHGVCIAYLPRNEPSLANAFFWHEPYDEQVAVAAINRCDLLARAIATYGAPLVLASAGPHLGGHGCARYGGPPARPVPATTADLLAV